MPAASPPIAALKEIRNAHVALGDLIDALDKSVRAKSQKQIDARAEHRKALDTQIDELQAALRNLDAVI